MATTTQVLSSSRAGLTSTVVTTSSTGTYVLPGVGAVTTQSSGSNTPKTGGNMPLLGV